MKNINIGVANLVVSDQLRESMFDDSLLVESKNTASKFFDVVKSSPILQLEFKVFSNLENKHILNEALAIKYIEDNVDLFETYTIDELSAEHEKLKSFIGEAVIENYKAKLYEAISTLVDESLNISLILALSSFATSLLDFSGNLLTTSYTYLSIILFITFPPQLFL